MRARVVEIPSILVPKGTRVRVVLQGQLVEISLNVEQAKRLARSLKAALTRAGERSFVLKREGRLLP